MRLIRTENRLIFPKNFYAQKYHKETQKGIKSSRQKGAKSVDYCRAVGYNLSMEKIILNEYTKVLAVPSFRLTAEKLVYRCGVRADLKGCKCLVEAVILYGTETCEEFCEIYRIIGALRGINYKSVMREITYAIAQAFNLCERLSEMIGTFIPPTDIHASLVIAYLGRLFKNPDLALYA